MVSFSRVQNMQMMFDYAQIFNVLLQDIANIC